MRRVVFVLLWAAVACEPPKGEPSLELTLTPRNVTDATPVKVRVIGTRGDGTVGTGTVKITSARGSLTTPVDVTLDSFGSATTDLICDPATEPECAGSVRVVGEWTIDGVATSAEARLNSGAATGGGAGGGTGTGGGNATFERTAYYIGEVVRDAFLIGFSFHALQPFSSVNQPRYMVPTNSDSWSVGPNNHIYYVTTNPREIHESIPEPLNTWTIGRSFENDTDIAHPCGPGSFALRQFQVFPDTGEYAFICVNSMLSSASVKMTDDHWVVKLGWNKNFIARRSTDGFTNFFELWRDGQKVADLPPLGSPAAAAGMAITVTAVPDGFLVNANCAVSKIDFTGGVTPLGNFTGSPPGFTANMVPQCCRASVTEDLKGFVSVQGNKLIGMCELSGTNTDLMTPATAPMQNWVGTPVVPPSFRNDFAQTAVF